MVSSNMKMLVVYINNILSVGHCMKEAIAEITKYYKAKDGSMKEPDIYLGADIRMMQLPNGCEVCTTSLRTYVKNAIGVVKHLLSEDGVGYVLRSNVKNTFPTGYQLELDGTDKLRLELASHFMQMIRILCWAVELGHIDIFLKVSFLS